MNENDPEFRYISQKTHIKVLQQFSSEEELIAFIDYFFDISQEIIRARIEMFTGEPEYYLSRSSNIASLVALSFKDNIEVIRDILKVLEYKLLTKEEFLEYKRQIEESE